MADNFQVTAGSGTTVATKDAAGVHHAKQLVEFDVSGTPTLVSSSAPLPVIQTGTPALPTGAAADATLTGGTQKAIVRGGAKGTTTAADVTSTASGANHNALDVILYDASGNAITSFGGGTQYADGASAATPTGTQINWNESGTQRGVTLAKSLPVQPGTSTTWAATQSGTWNITNISGTISLPTGAAADATLTGGTQKAIARGGAKGATTAADITSTASGANHQALDVVIYDTSGNPITSFGGGSGGTAMTDDAAFTVASTSVTPVAGIYRATRDLVDDGDAGAFAMNQRRAQYVTGDSIVSTANSTTSNLAGGAAFTGTSEDTMDFSLIQVSVYSSHASATDGLSLQQSSDGTNWDITDTYTISATSAKVISVQPAGRYFRLVYTNGGTLTTSLRIQTIYKIFASKGSSQRPADATSNENDFEMISAFAHLFNGTTWDRARGDTTNGLDVDVTRLPALVAGSATIGSIANITTGVVPGTGATSLGKAEDAAHASGDTGVMALAVRNDAGTALAGTTGDYIPLSTDATGALRVTGGGGGTQYAEDTVHASGDTGTLALAVRRDTPTSGAADGDYVTMNVNVNGGQWSSTMDCFSVSVTPTVSTTAYAANDNVGGKMTFANVAFSSAGSGRITGINIVDQANQKKNLRITIFSTDTASTTFTDNAATDVADGDMSKILAVVPINDWYSYVDNAVCTVPVDIPFKLSTGTSIYAAIDVTEAMTLAATSDIICTLVGERYV